MSNVADLTKLMLFFGRVPETHIKNLESFPFIYFNRHTADPLLNYSVATADKTTKTDFFYSLSLDLAENDQMEKRCKALETAVRALFWKEATVKVNVNDEEVYKSE